MHTYELKFGGAIAEQINHDGEFHYTSYGPAGYYVADAPYNPDALTDEAARMVEWTMHGKRDSFPRRIPEDELASNHPDPAIRRAYGGDNEARWTFGHGLHISHAETLADCTDHLNQIAADTGYWSQK